MRPCTGAVFLLVIGWRLDIRVASALAVLTMGPGTAALTSLVAVSSVAARGAAFASVKSDGSSAIGFHISQVVSGVAVIIASLSFLGFSV